MSVATTFPSIPTCSLSHSAIEPLRRHLKAAPTVGETDAKARRFVFGSR